METYILKTILCSAIFLGVYYLLLNYDKMLRFNRLYLLFSILLSMLLPFLTIEIEAKPTPIYEYVMIEENVATDNDVVDSEHLPTPIVEKPTNHTDTKDILIYISLTISSLLLIRFVRNIWHIRHGLRDDEEEIYIDGIRIILLQEECTPHSFLNCIYLNKQNYKDGKVEQEILTHEMAHIKQKHTIDILFIEFCLIFFWFNPFLYIYRRAIKINHEYLADNAVVDSSSDIARYKYMLIEENKQSNRYELASNLNYKLTKKRLIMMTKKTSFKMSLLKRSLIIPVCIAAVYVFSTKVIAKETNVSDKKEVVVEDIATTIVPQDSIKPMIITPGDFVYGKGATKEEIDECKALKAKYNISDRNILTDIDKMSEEDRDRLLQIIRTMSEDQMNARNVKVRGEDKLNLQDSAKPMLPEDIVYGKGATIEEIDEYKVLKDKYNISGRNVLENINKMPQKDKNRMIDIIKKMSKDQMNTYNVAVRTTIKLTLPKWKSDIKEGKGLSDNELAKYTDIVAQYSKNESVPNEIIKKIPIEDKKTLEELFMRMTFAQREKQSIVFNKKLPPLAKKAPTEEEFESWKDVSKYGVWIDDKRADNSVLDNYKSTDFSHYSVYRLYGKAKENKSYTFQLNVMTNKYYEDYLKRENAKYPYVISHRVVPITPVN